MKRPRKTESGFCGRRSAVGGRGVARAVGGAGGDVSREGRQRAIGGAARAATEYGTATPLIKLRRGVARSQSPSYRPRDGRFTLALFVIPLGQWAEEQVVPDGMGADAEPLAGAHLLSLSDVGALGFDCALKLAPAPPHGHMPADLNTPVTTSDLPAFFPSLLEPPPISGATATVP